MKKIYEKWTGREVNRDLFRDLLTLATPIMIYAPIYFIWFIALEKHTFSHYSIIHTRVDDLIPFNEIFVIPYYMWFLYVSVTLLFLLFSFDVEDYYKNFFFLAAGMTVFLVVSTLFPNMHLLRPAVFPRDNVFTSLVGIIYSRDTSTNLWPSIHVYNSIGTMIAIHRSKRFNRVGKVISDFIGISIILSTLFIKQHSVYDVITAFIMAIIFYIVFYHTTILEGFCVRQEARVAVRYN
ncbi:serine/threonine protein phosphatase [Butyrivibrio sp. AE2032]|uniref:serine/threonine protein phosphatase n=1 Tax=Butyrivibrio sp. AE2032 TaxID=1458463 RepID=UPI00068CFC60|nr:serine/threonine protein phosphatase [Butyrivibrio sp. AE2032]